MNPVYILNNDVNPVPVTSSTANEFQTTVNFKYADGTTKTVSPTYPLPITVASYVEVINGGSELKTLETFKDSSNITQIVSPTNPLPVVSSISSTKEQIFSAIPNAMGSSDVGDLNLLYFFSSSDQGKQIELSPFSLSVFSASTGSLTPLYSAVDFYFLKIVSYGSNLTVTPTGLRSSACAGVLSSHFQFTTGEDGFIIDKNQTTIGFHADDSCFCCCGKEVNDPNKCQKIIITLNGSTNTTAYVQFKLYGVKYNNSTAYQTSTAVSEGVISNSSLLLKAKQLN